jgi:hypothetical protein
MRSPFTVALAVAAALAVSAVAQEGGPRHGRWQVTMEMSMPGMPAGMPPFTVEQCVTREEAENPEALVPRGPGGRGMAPDNCKVLDNKVTGNKVTFAMRCEGADPMTMTGENTYANNSYQGTVKMTTKGQTMTMKYTGKRLGDCTK